MPTRLKRGYWPLGPAQIIDLGISICISICISISIRICISISSSICIGISISITAWQLWGYQNIDILVALAP